MINQIASDDRTHYVYIYLNPLESGEYYYDGMTFNYKPFYVGIGKNRRYYFHITEAKSYKMKSTNPYKTNVIKKIFKHDMLPQIIFIKTNLTRKEAGIIERDVISKFGYVCNNGILTNMTEGGEECATILNHPNKQSILEKFRIRSGGVNNSMYGKFGKDNPKSCKYVISKNGELDCVIYGGQQLNDWITNNKMSKRTFTNLYKKNKLCHNGIEIYKLNKSQEVSSVKFMSSKEIEEYENNYNKQILKKTRSNNALRGKRKYEVTTPKGEVFVIDNFSKFCRENKLHRATFRQVAYGIKEDYYGWKCKII